jgi:type I restriction enzyme, S subunit
VYVGGSSTLRTVRLGDVCEKIGSGATPRGGGDVYLSLGTALIRSQNVYNDGFKKEGLAFIDKIHADELSNVIIQSGDILLNITGDSVARVCQVPEEIIPARVNQHVAIIRPNKEDLDARYLRYFLISPQMQQKMLAFAAAGATRNALTKGMIESFDVPAPPLPEQRAIARILGSLDDKIELNRRMNETLEALARTLFKSWFVDFDPVRAKAEGREPAGMDAETAALFPDSFEETEMGETPKGWDVQKISKFCTLGRGASPRPINDYMNGEVPWIKIADATAASGPFLFETKEKVKIAGAEKSVAVVPGDLILSNSATCGVPMFVELHGCIHDGWLYFRNFSSISKIYFFHVLVELAEHLVHIADGSVQKNLNTNLVGQQNVLVPPKALVDAFDAQSSVWLDKMRQNGLESRTLAELRDLMLPKFLSGEIRVAY